ncbi:MAG: ATP-binding protein [Candidatus Thorarchaeota archaeon]|nr:MAG: ATP-binding protein [Candidatus Thorarchaeota archaeon]
MYELFEPSQRVFVGREEYLDWMDDALERCKEKSVVLHLRGIGGIGKSSLLDHWTSTIESTIRLDCEQYTDFFDRLNVLAKGAVVLGARLPRFDILWQIRQRFVEGVEPVKESGREWAKDVVMAIPFIGSMAAIGSAIGAVGAKVAPKLKGKYGDLGGWLQTRLGKNYLEKLLEILWKEPRWAEFLYLDALLEDLNGRKNMDDPMLILLDQFENVDDDALRWRYSGREISEAQLWRVFLSSLSNSVGVMASRRSVPTQNEIEIEESELAELDKESCVQLLNMKEITNPEIQNKIASVSGGNPFVIGTLCDAAKSESIMIDTVEDLRSDTLEEVRLKTWRRLFSETQDLTPLVDRAGLLPFFNRRIMTIIAPEMKTDQWDRLTSLSFVRDQGDGTWVLHDLAEELVIAELGERLGVLSSEMTTLLEVASEKESDFGLYGLSLTVKALANPDLATYDLAMKLIEYGNRPVYQELLRMLDFVRIDSDAGRLEKATIKGWILNQLMRYAEAEQALVEAMELSRELAKKDESFLRYLARTQHILGIVYLTTNRMTEAEKAYNEAVEIFRLIWQNVQARGEKLDHPTLLYYLNSLRYLGFFLTNRIRYDEAEPILEEAVRIAGMFPKSGDHFTRSETMGDSLSSLSLVQLEKGMASEAEASIRAAIDGIPNPDMADPYSLSLVYSRLAHILLLTNRQDEAEENTKKALAIVQDMYEREPEGFAWSNLAGQLTRLSVIQSRKREYAESEESVRKAVEIARKHAKDDILDAVAFTLHELAYLLLRTGRLQEAETSFLETIEIFRRFADISPNVYIPDLTRALKGWGVLLRHTDRSSEAEVACYEALEKAREISNKFPYAVFRTEAVANILNNLGVLLRQKGDLTAAESAYREALDLKRELSERSLELFFGSDTTVLNNLAVLLAGTDEDESEALLKEALILRRKLVERTPGLYEESLASTLNNVGILQKQKGMMSEAKEAYREAETILEELMLEAPSVYERDLRRILANSRILLSESGESTEEVEARLGRLGVKQMPRKEEWSEEEL